MIAPDAGLREGVECQPSEHFAWDTRRLWSLWDMLDRYAWYFFILAQLLERLHHELGVPLPVTFPPAPISPAVGNALLALSSGLGGAYGLASAPQLPLPTPTPSNDLRDDQKFRLKGILDLIETICKNISVTRIFNDVRRAKDYIDTPFPERQKVIFYIESISHRVIDELHEEKFLHIKADKAKHYQNIDMVDRVGKKLPKIFDDLYHAGSCFAVEQYTACVFHLMRVLEYCVQRLGRKLKVSIDVSKEPWA
jgi:hypothetical protein